LVFRGILGIRDYKGTFLDPLQNIESFNSNNMKHALTNQYPIHTHSWYGMNLYKKCSRKRSFFFPFCSRISLLASLPKGCVFESYEEILLLITHFKEEKNVYLCLEKPIQTVMSWNKSVKSEDKKIDK
jgi:hypothetical protein